MNAPPRLEDHISRGLSLPCYGASALCFTVGRAYPVVNVFAFGDYAYFEVPSESGLVERFTTAARRQVRNEHTLEFAWMVFEKPLALSRAEALYREAQAAAAAQRTGHVSGGTDEISAVVDLIASKGCLRPLIITIRPSYWRDRLQKKHGSTATALLTPLDFNRVILAGVPPAFYTTHLKTTFLNEDGSPTAALLDNFDFLFTSNR